MQKKNMKFRLQAILIISIILVNLQCIKPKKEKKLNSFQLTEKNYGKQIDKYSKKFLINKNYLKALIILESSGNLNPPHRFEKNIYDSLKKLQAGKIEKFENITPELVKNLSDTTLKEMASSWGPFQLMGYKCVILNTSIESIKGDDIFFYSVKWIDETYGHQVRIKSYKDAFHLHNAGKMYPDSGPPRTYHPDYVSNGIKYMKYYERRDSLKINQKTEIKITVNKSKKK